MRKRITLFVILVLAVMLFCGCGKKTNTGFEAVPVTTDNSAVNYDPSGSWKLDSLKNSAVNYSDLFTDYSSDTGSSLSFSSDSSFSISIGNQYSGTGVYSVDGNKITATFSDIAKNTYSQIFEMVQIDGTEYLKSNIRNTILYWSKGEYVKTTPTPIPTVIAQTTPTPIPTITIVGNAVNITKNPTGETVDEGGKATFVAKADNYTNIVWVIVSPDAKKIYYSANDATKDFTGLKVEGQGTEKLVLSNIPAAMNGYRVQCYFEGYGGPLYTSGAYITVKKAGTSPTPGPESASQLAKDYAQVVKKYADYSHWTMSEIQNFKSNSGNGYDEFQLTLTRGAVKMVCVLRTYPTENTCYPESITWYESDTVKAIYPYGRSDSESWNHFEKTILDITATYGDGTAGQSMQ